MLEWFVPAIAGLKGTEHSSARVLEKLSTQGVEGCTGETPCSAFTLAPPSIDAWVYLAYLHAVTSSDLPDPLTGISGKEAAMDILQSGRC